MPISRFAKGVSSARREGKITLNFAVAGYEIDT